MEETSQKFSFPHRGFYIVTDKIAETDFFLERLIESQNFSAFPFYFSAFVSAARSVTFALQAVMAEIPGFNDWYASERRALQDSSLAKFFVQLRNHLQKVGSVPVSQSGKFDGDNFLSTAYFIPIATDRLSPHAGLRKELGPGPEVLSQAQRYRR
ncbi:MAG: hypothetical protein AB1941_25215 [Gemmatimonadota bacterium]